jgi:CheY-like chemotaxis protein
LSASHLQTTRNDNTKAGKQLDLNRPWAGAMGTSLLNSVPCVLYSATLSSSHVCSAVIPQCDISMSSPDTDVSNSARVDLPAKAPRALILVVERNPLVQHLEKFFLEQAGYTVEFTSDGVSALERARKLLPQILVTEILVPKLDGLSLCRALKSDPLTKEILVLVFSHLHAEDRALEANADAFLIKPLNEQLLIETVRKLIDQHLQGAGSKS